MITTMRSGETGTAGRCVPVIGNSNYLPFCEVEWRGITGWASSCCIPNMEETPSPPELPPSSAYEHNFRVMQDLALTMLAVVTRARETAPIPARSDADRPAPAGWAALRLLANVDISF